MNKKYFVKTRNWHCKMWVRKFLDVAQLWGAYRGDSYNDGDGKFCFETNSYLKAILTWVYFMLFYHLSGGWTYMVDNNRKFLFNSDPEKGKLYL